MDIYGYSASVLINGRKAREYVHNGLTFIEAREGTEFSIEVKNHSTGRILAIVSIDGLDIIEGKPATADSRGYIIAGNHADTFNGWRTSDTEVGAFKFTSSDKSYATSKGVGQNNGVIAIKLFAEKHETPQYITKSLGGNMGGFLGNNAPITGYAGGTLRSRGLSADYSATACSATAYSVSLDNSTPVAVASFDMGTTWGSKKEEKVVTKDFKKGSEITTFNFYYASREALIAMGVPLTNSKSVSLPQGFSSYATPPANWR